MSTVDSSAARRAPRETSDPRSSGAADALAGPDLITSWGLVEEGFRYAHAAVADEIESAGLPILWFEVLIRLLRTPGHRLPMNRLAADIAMTSGGYTKLVDRMEAAELVERVPAVDDRRVIFTSLTATGRTAAESALARHLTHLQTTVLAPLSAAQIESLASIMRVLRDALVPGPAGADTEPDAD